MKYKLYVGSKNAWRGMVSSILRAKKYIYIEMYILDNRAKEFDFLNILAQKVKEGLEVVLVLDSFGSSDFKNSDIKYLKDNGIEVLFFSKLLRRTHRKMIIIDDRVIFLGGVNFHGKSVNWTDLQIKASNKILARNVLRSFSYSYQMSGGKKEHILDKINHSVFRSLKFQFLEHFPSHNVYTLEKYYKDKIISAKKSILIVTPYFIPPRWLMALLDSAVSRGVRVEIIIPLNCDLKFLDRINYVHIYQYRNTGIKFYAHQEMNHSKLLLIDDREILIGSQNLDIFSFKISVESGVFLTNKNLIIKILSIVEGWKKNSTNFYFKKKRINIFNKLILVFVRMFYSIL